MSSHRTILFFCFLILICHSLQATDLTTITGNPTTLATQLQSPKSLVLIIADKQELREAQRLLTLATSQNLHTLILIALPNDQPLTSATTRQAAKRFFKSEYSRSHIHFIDTDQLPHPTAKSLLLAPDEQAPLWKSSAFPSNADFETALFQTVPKSLD